MPHPLVPAISLIVAIACSGVPRGARRTRIATEDTSVRGGNCVVGAQVQKSSALAATAPLVLEPVQQPAIGLATAQ